MQRIVKIAKNNVEVQTVYFDEKVDGKEVIVHRQTYGQTRINDERAASISRDAAILLRDDADDRAVETAKQAVLDDIQTEMNK